MTERPILFSGPMVRAILAGTKTQTWRVMKPPAEVIHAGEGRREEPWQTKCWVDPGLGGGAYLKVPYSDGTVQRHGARWVVGDRLYVREAWQPAELPDGTDGIRFRADDSFVPIDNTPGATERWIKVHGGIDAPNPGRWRPSIHMPKWAARLWLEVIEVRVERLQAITADGAEAEGVTYEAAMEYADEGSPDFVLAFRDLWDSINGKRGYGWEANPWVWVVRFEVAP